MQTGQMLQDAVCRLTYTPCATGGAELAPAGSLNQAERLEPRAPQMGQSHWFPHPFVSDLRCVSLPFRLLGPAEILAERVLNVVVIILRRRGAVPDDLGIKAEG